MTRHGFYNTVAVIFFIASIVSSLLGFYVLAVVFIVLYLVGGFMACHLHALRLEKEDWERRHGRG